MSETVKRTNPCEHCGTEIYSGPPDCPRCGAPNCCPKCCEEAEQYLLSRAPSPEVEAKPETTGEVDLSVCQSGDVCWLRGGGMYYFKGRNERCDKGIRPYMADRLAYTRTGRCFEYEHILDIIRVTRDGIQITPSTAEPSAEGGVKPIGAWIDHQETCGLCGSAMRDGSCTGDPDGCVMVVTGGSSAAPGDAVVKGPGVYRTRKYDERPKPEELAHVDAVNGEWGYGYIGSPNYLRRWSLRTGKQCNGDHIDITGPYVPTPKPVRQQLRDDASCLEGVAKCMRELADELQPS